MADTQHRPKRARSDDGNDGNDGGNGARVKRVKHNVIEHSRRMDDPADMESQVVAAASGGDGHLIILYEDGVYRVDVDDPDNTTRIWPELSLGDVDHQPDGNGDVLSNIIHGLDGLENLAISSETCLCPLVVGGIRRAHRIYRLPKDTEPSEVLPNGLLTLEVVGSLPVTGANVPMIVMVRLTTGETILVVPDDATGTMVPLRVDSDEFTIDERRGQPLEMDGHAASARIVGNAIVTVHVNNMSIIVRRNGQDQATVPLTALPRPVSFFVSPWGKIAWTSLGHAGKTDLYGVGDDLLPTLIASGLPASACFHPVGGVVGGASADFGAVIDNSLEPTAVDLIDFRCQPPSIVARLVVPPDVTVGSLFPHGKQTVFCSAYGDNYFLFYPFDMID